MGFLCRIGGRPRFGVPLEGSRVFRYVVSSRGIVKWIGSVRWKDDDAIDLLEGSITGQSPLFQQVCVHRNHREGVEIPVFCQERQMLELIQTRII